jgi:hypothetical protein
MTALIFSLAIAAVGGTAWTPSAHTHIRPVDRNTESILTEAARLSPTVAQLLAQIEERNVIVYIGSGVGLRARGLLNFLGYGEPVVYLKMSVELRQGAADRAGAIAHELTHVLEISDSPMPIRREDDLIALYGPIGRLGDQRGDVESERARVSELLARREAWRASTRSPS